MEHGGAHGALNEVGVAIQTVSFSSAIGVDKVSHLNDLAIQLGFGIGLQFVRNLLDNAVTVHDKYSDAKSINVGTSDS